MQKESSERAKMSELTCYRDSALLTTGSLLVFELALVSSALYKNTEAMINLLILTGLVVLVGIGACFFSAADLQSKLNEKRKDMERMQIVDMVRKKSQEENKPVKEEIVN